VGSKNRIYLGVVVALSLNTLKVLFIPRRLTFYNY